MNSQSRDSFQLFSEVVGWRLKHIANSLWKVSGEVSRNLPWSSCWENNKGPFHVRSSFSFWEFFLFSLEKLLQGRSCLGKSFPPKVNQTLSPCTFPLPFTELPVPVPQCLTGNSYYLLVLSSTPNLQTPLYPRGFAVPSVYGAVGWRRQPSMSSSMVCFVPQGVEVVEVVNTVVKTVFP